VRFQHPLDGGDAGRLAATPDSAAIMVGSAFVADGGRGHYQVPNRHVSVQHAGAAADDELLAAQAITSSSRPAASGAPTRGEKRLPFARHVEAVQGWTPTSLPIASLSSVARPSWHSLSMTSWRSKRRNAPARRSAR